jgi:hypothetical protein
MIWQYSGGCLLVVIVFYLFVVILEARDKVRNAPRANAFMCDVHGFIHEKLVLKLDMGQDKPVLQCPICFDQKYRKAEEAWKRQLT